MISKKLLMNHVCELFCLINDLEDEINELDRRINKLEPKKEKRCVKKVSK